MENIKQLPAFKVDGVPWPNLRNNWNEYKKEFKYIVKAMTEKQKKKVKTIFLNMAGREVQKIVETLENQDLEEEEFDDGLGSTNEIEEYRHMMALLDNYFQPKHHEILQRYEFAAIQPNPNETMDKFLMRIKTAVTICNFGQDEIESKQIAVIDKIVRFAPQDMKEKILRRDWHLDELTQFISTYVKTKDECEALNETQLKCNSSMSNNPSSSNIIENVARIQPVKRANTWSHHQTPKKECTRCGFDQTKEARCPAARVVCAHCKRIGHYARKCFFKIQEEEKSQGSKLSKPGEVSIKRPHESKYDTNKRHKVRNIECDQEKLEEEITNIEVSAINDFNDAVMLLSIGGVFVKLLIDSGCKHNLITTTTLEYLKRNNADLNDFGSTNIRMCAYGQSNTLQIKTKFNANLAVSANESGTMATFYVVSEGTQNLLGRETAMEIGILKIGLPINERLISNVEIKTPEFPCIKGK